VPLVEDESWFFDTELLLLADHNDLRIHEVAVDWVDDPDSRVRVVRTALDDLAGVARMVGRFATGGGDIDRAALRSPGPDDDMGRQLVVFAAVGALCTVISLASFLGLRPHVGPLAANVVATSGTALVNAWLNHRATFGRRGRAPWRRDLHRSLALHAALLAVSSVALLAVGAAGLGVVAEVVALVAVWLVVAVARFRWLRS
jgi:putative flippase GtrA